jgi:hypothetical protein
VNGSRNIRKWCEALPHMGIRICPIQGRARNRAVVQAPARWLCGCVAQFPRAVFLGPEVKQSRLYALCGSKTRCLIADAMKAVQEEMTVVQK